MSSVLALAPRAFATPILPASVLGGGKELDVQAKHTALVEPDGLVDADDDGVSLSRQSLTRAGELASSTVDVAQKFVDTLVQRLFGDAGRAATVSVAAVSAQAQTAFTGEAGPATGTALSLRASASFTGSGEIATADGQRFAFTLELAYQASVQAALAPSPAPARLLAPDVLTLTGTPLPAIEFPGSLNDLFKLLGRELRAPLGGKDGGGDLTMRLLRLVDQAALLAPRPKAEQAPAPLMDRSKQLASSYGSAPV